MSLGVPESLAKFSLPLGATVNMNGTALYEGTYFVSQIPSTVCPYKTDTFFYLSQR
jgi:Na+/H+-dicarboxylate symporter